MLIRIINGSLTFALIGTLSINIFSWWRLFFLKPGLPEINLVDEDVLQIPLKFYSADGVLIGEFGDQKEELLNLKIFQKILKMHF